MVVDVRCKTSGITRAGVYDGKVAREHDGLKSRVAKILWHGLYADGAMIVWRFGEHVTIAIRLEDFDSSQLVQISRERGLSDVQTIARQLFKDVILSSDALAGKDDAKHF